MATLFLETRLLHQLHEGGINWDRVDKLSRTGAEQPLTRLVDESLVRAGGREFQNQISKLMNLVPSLDEEEETEN